MDTGVKVLIGGGLAVGGFLLYNRWSAGQRAVDPYVNGTQTQITPNQPQGQSQDLVHQVGGAVGGAAGGIVGGIYGGPAGSAIGSTVGKAIGPSAAQGAVIGAKSHVTQVVASVKGLGSGISNILNGNVDRGVQQVASSAVRAGATPIIATVSSVKGFISDLF